jgi:hypothetical protein
VLIAAAPNPATHTVAPTWANGDDRQQRSDNLAGAGVFAALADPDSVDPKHNCRDAIEQKRRKALRFSAFRLLAIQRTTATRQITTIREPIGDENIRPKNHIPQ